MNLAELVALNGYPIAGWNEGRRRLSVQLGKAPRLGLYYVHREGFRVGTLSVSAPQGDAYGGPNAHLPCRWPRVRALLLDTRQTPWSAMCIVTTEIDLRGGMYELVSHDLHRLLIPMAVNGLLLHEQFQSPQHLA